MANKAIFLDRDDTLIEDPGYINHPDQVKLIDGTAEALTELRAMGYKLVVVTNQSALARGIITEQVLEEIHDKLKSLLAEKGANLDAIYYCPYHPDGIVPKYRRESDLRKPSPGMLLAAAEEMELDLSQSWAAGNSDRDVEAGKRAGCKTILLDSRGHDKNLVPSLAKPDYRAVNLKEVVNIIKKYHRSAAMPAEPESNTQAVAEPQPQEKIEQNSTPQIISTEPTPTGDKTEQLLMAILAQLKSSRREEMFGADFSPLRMLAGFVQVIVLFCLMVSIWVLMNPARHDSSVLIALMFAMVFQLMALTFYWMQGRK